MENEKNKTKGIMNMMQNSSLIAIKQFMFKLLEKNYAEFDDVITRATHNLVTEGDMNSFAKLMNKIYELGYQKAINDYKSELSKMNIVVNYKKDLK